MIGELTLTNLSPLILMNFGVVDHVFLDDINSLPRIRTLIFRNCVKKNWMTPLKTAQLSRFTIDNGWRLLNQYVQRKVDSV